MASTPRKPDVVNQIEQLGRPALKLPAPPTAYVKSKNATAPLILTEAYADLPGCSFTTPFAANWDVRTYVDIEGAGAFLFWQLLCNGVTNKDGGEGHSNISGRLSLALEHQTGYVAAGSIIKIVGKRSGGSGTIYSGHSRLVCQRCI